MSDCRAITFYNVPVIFEVAPEEPRPKYGAMSYADFPRQDGENIGSSGEAALLELASNPDRWALFLDIDGTLIDLADTPDAIVVPPQLPSHLHQLSRRLNGALALVTGRGLPYADQLFVPYRFPIAGLHGAERRDPAGTISRFEPDAAFYAVKTALAEEAAAWPGVLIEDKGAAVAAHYRQAPEQRDAVEQAMSRYLEKAGRHYALQRGKMVLEIRPAEASKGSALRAFLDQPPFEGRKPLAIGDDVTDEAMFRMANQLGGHSIRIADSLAGTDAQSFLPSANALRSFISGLAEQAQSDIDDGKE